MPLSVDHTRLFRSGRPIVRPIDLAGNSGETSDVECLWRAYQHAPYLYFGSGLSRPNFVRTLELMSGRIITWVAQYDPVPISKPPIFAAATLQDDGWRVEPHVHYLPWATPKDVLTATASFLQTMRDSPSVGYCVVYSHAETKNLFDRCCALGLLEPAGTIEPKPPRKREYVYFARGAKPESAKTPGREGLIR